MQINNSIKSLKTFLNSLHPIDDSTFTEYISHCEEVTFKKGDKLIAQGQYTDRVFFIVSGLVRFYYITNTGQEVIKSFYSDNSVVTSYSALLMNQVSNLNIECIEDTTVLSAPYLTIRALNDCSLALQICARKIAEKEFISKDLREYEFLTMDSKERYLSFQQRCPEMAERIPLKYIASYLGIRSETLSRIKSES